MHAAKTSKIFSNFKIFIDYTAIIIIIIIKLSFITRLNKNNLAQKRVTENCKLIKHSFHQHHLHIYVHSYIHTYNTCIHIQTHTYKHRRFVNEGLINFTGMPSLCSLQWNMKFVTSLIRLRKSRGLSAFPEMVTMRDLEQVIPSQLLNDTENGHRVLSHYTMHSGAK